MSPVDEMSGEFERQARLLLEESASRVDARVRSRLNQARHAALEESSRQRPFFLSRFVWMPAAGAVAAAALVAFVLWPHSPRMDLPMTEATHATAEDLDLLADGDGLDLVSAEEADGAFFEWAVAQTDPAETSTT